MTLPEAAKDFLTQKRIAIVGVSRDSKEPANFVFRRLRDAGHEVFPVNPRAEQLEGVPCHPNLRAIPGGVDAAVVFTPPQATTCVVRECADLGIRRVWLHRSLGPGSVSDEAIRVAGENGITLIPGACPAMFCQPVDIPHRCIRWFLDLAGRLPRSV